MKVIKNYLYNAFYQVFILIVPLVTTPYLARVLGPKGVGINSYTNSIIQYFILFGSLGVNLYGNRQIAFVRNDRQRLTATFYEIFLMRLITVVVASLVFGVFFGLVSNYRIYYLAQAISLVAVIFDISWFFMGIENFAVTVLRNFVIKILTLISIFTLVKSKADLTIYILILSLSLLIGNLTLFPSLHKYIGRPRFCDLQIAKHFKPALILFIPQIATQIYVVLNKTMLGSMVSVQASGYFDQSDKIIKMVLAVVTATGTVMLPHVANAFANGHLDKAKEYLYTSFSFITMSSIPMMLGLMAITAKFVPLFFTYRFHGVIPIMLIEALIIILVAWSNAIGMQYLLPTNQTKAYTMSVILGAAVNLIANIPLIFFWGTVGAALSTVLSELSVTLYQLVSIRRQVSYRKLFDDTYKYLLSGLIMFWIVFSLDRILPNGWFSIIFEVSIGFLTYLTLMMLFKVKMLTQAKRFLKK